MIFKYRTWVVSRVVILVSLAAANMYASYVLLDKSDLVGFIPLAVGCVVLNALYERACNGNCKRI